jgi:hypothetical protein
MGIKMKMSLHDLPLAREGAVELAYFDFLSFLSVISYS